MNRVGNIDWYYASLLLFAVALPFSEALISVSGVLLFITSLLSVPKGQFSEKIRKGKLLILFSSIYLVYLLGFIFCNDMHWGMYDLQKNLPYLLIPIAFIFAKKLKAEQIKTFLLTFSAAVSLSALITVVNFYLSNQNSVLDAQEFGFIHHIRFSFEVIFSIFILSVLFVSKQVGRTLAEKSGVLLVIIFLLLFLIWHQSFTGIITFLATSFVGLIIVVMNLKRSTWKMVAGLFIFLLVLVPSAYLYYAVTKYYQVDQINYDDLEMKTTLGNPYFHNIENKQIENGHFVGLYLCQTELEEAWNSRSSLKYDERDVHGYQVKETLIRYLTSKNLRKDAQGVEQLTDQDVANIESGISNYILAQKGLSLYPRLYVTIWGLDTYFSTGYANQQSLSQRFEYGKAALHIIKEHFWFGVGTGNWKAAYREAYQAIGSQMAPARYGDAHNQYLNYTVKFGIVGALWILFVIIFPILKTKTYRNPVFFLFLVSMLIANLGDSNLETHVGGSFFVLLYCIFVSSEEWKIDWKKWLAQ